MDVNRFDRLIVGFDGSDGGRDALALSAVLAAPDAGITVVAVFPYGPFPLKFAALHEEAERDAAPLFAEARETLSGTSVATEAFGGGSPAWVIEHLVEERGADLIVVGSPHRGAVGRVLLGSVARNLLHGSACPVAIAPAGYRERAAKTGLGLIAVAYDGSLESHVALARAVDIARASSARLRVLTVEGPNVTTADMAGYIPRNPPTPEKVLAEGKSKAGDEVEVEGELLHGSTAMTLASACADGVDLLVMSSRRYGPARRVLLGSVATEVIGLAPCPVLVVPRPGDRAEEQGA